MKHKVQHNKSILLNLELLTEAQWRSPRQIKISQQVTYPEISFYRYGIHLEIRTGLALKQ